ncbi:SH2 domain-containing 1A [Sigmodon hispidus]
MAVDLGDHFSGFRHSEVIRFINNEILMNGGGPDFYMAFRMKPWNEIEDQLRTILIDPQLPRPLKRACTWSALALSVRIGARQREQQAYMVGLPQDAMGQRPSAPRASVSELWQLRQQREEAVTQLLSTQAALQQALRECDMLRRRLYHADRSTQMAPLVQDIVPGAQAQQLGGASVVPLNPDHTRVMGAMGGYDRQYLEAQMSAASNVIYMPGSTSPWPVAMQPSVPVPMPYQFPPHPPFLMGPPFLMPFSHPVVMETEGGVVVPVQVPPVYPPGPFAAPYSQDPAGLWDQRYYRAAEGPPVIQHPVPPGNVRNFSQEGDPEKIQQTDTRGDNKSQIQGQSPRRTQERPTLVDIGNDSKEGEENEKDKEEATEAVSSEAKVAQPPPPPAAAVAIAAAAAAPAANDDNDDDDNDDDAETAAEEKAVASAAAHDNTVKGLQGLQALHLTEEGELPSQREKSFQASSLAPLGSKRGQIKEGVEEAQPTPVWESWSQAVRESPKREQPQLPKKDKKSQVEAASETQPMSPSGTNWICSKCKAMNYSWRKFCYKCKRVCTPAEGGGQTDSKRLVYVYSLNKFPKIARLQCEKRFKGSPPGMDAVTVYHGKISRETGEKLLLATGLDGSYLLRDSESVPGVYCLCVLYQGYIYTYRVSQTETGSWSAETAPGVHKRFFRKIKNLITAFQKPDQGIVIPLQYPVEKSSPRSTQGRSDSDVCLKAP